MGFLDRWDKRNQDILEWHQHLEQERTRSGAKIVTVSVLELVAIGRA